MPQIDLTLHGVTSAEDLNRVTTALMMLDGVESVDIGNDWAVVEGRASRGALIATVDSLSGNYSAK